MRFLWLAILMSCSSSVPLKYKFHSSKEYLASLTDEKVVVSRIELFSKDPMIFASGMDSTQLVVKLFDKNGNLLSNVDPSDLTLSSSEDIEAKPFSYKHGVYKADLLPRPKSRDIWMQVDWLNKVKSKVIVLRATTSPLRDELKPLNHEYVEAKSQGEVMVGRGSRSPASASEEFSFVNVGENKIIKALNSSRTFHFEYPEHARQNIAMEVDDAPNDIVSHTMHSYFMFFPRKQLPVLEQFSDKLEVTLPTGEKVIFNKETKEIISGVFKEGPLDMSPDKFKRAYPDLRYRGRGVVLRANARGQSPQLGQYEKDKIDSEFGNRGSVDVLIYNATTGERCRRPKTDFWDNHDVSPIEFKFATDEEFEIYLQNHCGFGLPKF